MGTYVATVKLKGAGAFDLHIAPERDIPASEKKSYCGCKIVYELFEQGAAAPTSEKQLTDGRFVRKKKESFVFQPRDSGYENSKGEAGPWRPQGRQLVYLGVSQLVYLGVSQSAACGFKNLTN